MNSNIAQKNGDNKQFKQFYIKKILIMKVKTILLA